MSCVRKERAEVKLVQARKAAAAARAALPQAVVLRRGGVLLPEDVNVSVWEAQAGQAISVSGRLLREKVLSQYRFVLQRLYEYGVPAFIVDGTFLGAYRNCNINANDHDLDLVSVCPLVGASLLRRL